jgi:putative membrane protein
MMDWGYGSGTGGWVAMAFMMVVVWGALALLAFWLVHELRTPGDMDDRSTARADALLNERLARGDIDEEEFRRLRALLHGGRV